MTRGRKRIIQIGFNRCGTRTLHGFFLRNGISSVHWERGRIAKQFYARKAAGEDPFTDYNGSLLRLRRHTVALTDMQFLDGKVLLEPFKDYEYIHRFYPDAYYILNTRDRESWVRSRILHGAGNFLRRYQSYLGGAGVDEVCDVWRRDWDDHHTKARAFFRDSGARFLDFNIETDDVATICEFLSPDFGELDSSEYVAKRSKPYGSSVEEITGIAR